jgi:hypothetical protein
MSGANYGGRQANNTAYIKTFVEGSVPLSDTWRPSIQIVDKQKVNALTPSNEQNIYVPNNIYFGGSIIHTGNTLDNGNTLNNGNTLDNSYNIQVMQKQITELQKQVLELQKQINKKQ